VHVRIRGHHPPGRTFRTAEAEYGNVHVGVQEKRDPVGLVPGDTRTPSWDLDVSVVRADGERDFRGPAVQGRRGDRFLYLTWGDVDPASGFRMFRRAKLMLGAIDPALVAEAEHAGRTLEARVDLSDEHGCPRCARVQPPALEWRVR